MTPEERAKFFADVATVIHAVTTKRPKDKQRNVQSISLLQCH